MAGRGPAPKPPEQRRRRNAPERGEWTTLSEVDPKKPILPKLPTRRRTRDDPGWHPRTKAAWEAWRMDPATTAYGPAEILAAIELAWVHDAWLEGREKGSEVRLRMDGLGLTPKGKRDLRWRTPAETQAAEPELPAGGNVRSIEEARKRVRAV